MTAPRITKTLAIETVVEIEASDPVAAARWEDGIKEQVSAWVATGLTDLLAAHTATFPGSVHLLHASGELRSDTAWRIRHLIEEGDAFDYITAERQALMGDAPDLPLENDYRPEHDDAHGESRYFPPDPAT